jgi:hypothetical protein
MEGAKTNVELVYETLGAYLRGDEETLRALIRDGRGTRFHVYPTVESALDAARKLADE